MTAARPVLYVFAISHYCEKARWALDHLSLDHEVRFLPPGPHIGIAQELGAPESSLPILVAGDRVVQGSAAIIDWADAASTDEAKRLTPVLDRETCRQIEQRLDDVLGVHARRAFYSEALVDHPESVQRIFARDLPESQASAMRESWDVVRQLMIAAMDLGAEQGQESKRLVEAELDWLDDLLADGRRHLIGDRFSRADLTAASLLAPLATPPQHPTYADLEIPPRLSADLALWRDRRSIRWVCETYEAYR